jgi:hypothetical protein
VLEPSHAERIALSLSHANLSAVHRALEAHRSVKATIEVQAGSGGEQRDLYEILFDCRDDDEEVRRRLVYWLEDFRKDNQGKIDSLGRYYLGAAVALMLQLVFWSLALAATIS